MKQSKNKTAVLKAKDGHIKASSKLVEMIQWDKQLQKCI